MKQKADIEALVIWTFRDQKADKVVGASSSGLPAATACNAGSLTRHAELGTKIDQSRLGQTSVDPDAERIYEAVLALNGAAQALLCRHRRVGAP